MRASDSHIRPLRVVAREPRRVYTTAETVAFAVTHAVLFAAAFAGIGLWPLTFISVAPLAWLAINARSTRRAVITVLLVQFLMWMWINRWIMAVTAVGYPLLAVYMSLYAALFVWIIRRIGRHPRLGRWPAALLVPLVWVGLECLRGELAFDGYPWYLAAHPTIEWPLLVQSADLLGTYFLSFLTVMVAGVLVDLMRVRGGQATFRSVLLPALLVLAVHTANVAYGIGRLAQRQPLSPGPTLLVVQTNLPQDNKMGWTKEGQQRDVPGFINLTRSGFEAAGRPMDLIVWPETMVPGVGLEPDTLEIIRTAGEDRAELHTWADAVAALSQSLRTPMLVGSPAWVEPYVVEDDQGQRWAWRYDYNSAYLIQGSPPYQRYDKFFLTPFGETMPYISKWPWLERKVLAVGAKGMRFNLDASPTIRRLELRWPPRTESSQASPPNAGKSQTSMTLATPICFEDTLAGVCRKMIYPGRRKAADLLVNLSNDGWFGSYDAGRRQHAQIARFRCIENRVPMVRAVNTGLSVTIDSTGRLAGVIGEGRYGTARRSGSLLAELQLDSRSTLYGCVGDVWAWGCLVATAALVGWTMVLAAGVSRT